MSIEQVTILAMELDRSHLGKLVQIITDSWSLTGTLTRADQHDNREWDYGPGGSLIPRFGEIYAVLKIGPWEGRVIGNQPVTVETVKGTLEAPERNRLRPFAPVTMFLSDEDLADAAEIRPAVEAAIEGALAEDLPSTIHDVHLLHPEEAGRFTLCGLRPDGDPGWIPDRLKVTENASAVTCRECRRRGWDDDLPPEPPAEWSTR